MLIQPDQGTAVPRWSPDTCPVCRHACEAMLQGEPALFPEHGDESEKKLQFVFCCPRQRCGSLFIVEYSGSPWFLGLSMYPQVPADAKIAEGIGEISPNFVKILNQSLAAESHNLDQIVGIGLRKALEFLIKDYCFHMHPEKAVEIKTRSRKEGMGKHGGNV